MEKFFLAIILVLLFLSCGNSKKSIKSVIGTWALCTKSGSYNEYEITKDYALFMSSKDERIALYKNQLKDSFIVWSSWNLEHNPVLLGDSVPIKPIFRSGDKLKLVVFNAWGFDTLLLTKKKFRNKEVDLSNLDSWKNETLTEFKSRARKVRCEDIRSEAEKAPIYIDSIDEEDLSIKEENKN